MDCSEKLRHWVYDLSKKWGHLYRQMISFDMGPREVKSTHRYTWSIMYRLKKWPFFWHFSKKNNPLSTLPHGLDKECSDTQFDCMLITQAWDQYNNLSPWLNYYSISRDFMTLLARPCRRLETGNPFFSRLVVSHKISEFHFHSILDLDFLNWNTLMVIQNLI